MTRKYKNFYYTLTPRTEPHNDVLLHITAQPESQAMYCNSYPDVPSAIEAAEIWIERAHKTVLDYYRGSVNQSEAKSV